MPPLRPSDFANQRLYADYYSTYADDYPMTGYPTWRVGEHNALLNFVRKNTATHIFATNDGWWNVATNWAVWNGSGWMTANTVPGANAQVLIGEGTVCTFNSGPNATTTDLYWIRVDGVLKFPTNANAHLVVDTIVSTPNSYYEMGTISNPLPHQHTINIEFSTARGWINTNTDISKVSRGLVLSGPHRIYGQEKTHAIRTASNLACNIGQTQITLENIPSYWNVGDRISIMGTQWVTQGPLYPPSGNSTVFNPAAWQDPRVRWGGRRSQTEETVTITNVSGNVITFTPAVIFNHRSPNNPWQNEMPIKPWIRNLTRNIKFSTKNGANIYSIPVQQRAHSMVMHQPNSQIGWAEFFAMGRTHKGSYTITGLYKEYPWYVQNTVPAGAKQNTAMYLPQNTHPTGGMTLFSASSVAFGWYPSSGITGDITLTVEGLASDRTTPLTETLVLNQWGSRIDSGSINYPNTALRINNNKEAATTNAIFGVIKSVTPRVAGNISNGTIIGTLDVFAYNRNLRIGSAVNGYPGASAGFRIPHNGSSDGSAPNWTYIPMNPYENAQGRYSFHVHRSGTDKDAVRLNPTAIGLVASDSFGWGFAHHDAHYNFVDCIAHRVGGAGFTAERGNESGIWFRCHSTNISGDEDVTHKGATSTWWGDIGSMSSAFWFTGRAVKASECVGDSCFGGYIYNVRFGEGWEDVTREQFDFPETLKGKSGEFIDHIPLLHFSDNEAAAMWVGLVIIKASQHQDHDVRTVLNRFKTWSISEMGSEITYTQHYSMLDFLSIKGFIFQPESNPNYFWDWHMYGRGAFTWGANVSDQALVRPRFSDWYKQVDMFHGNANEGTNTQELSTDNPENHRIIVDPDYRIPAGAGNAYSDLKSFDRVIVGANSINVSASITFGYENIGYVPISPSLSHGWPTENVTLTQGVLAGQTIQIGFPPQSFRGWRVTTNSHNTLAQFGPNFHRQGSFTDRLGTDPWPGGVTVSRGEDMSEIRESDWNQRILARMDKIWQYNGNNFIFVDEMYSDRWSGEIYKRCVPYNLGSPPTNFSDWASYIGGTINLASTIVPTAPNISINVQKNQTTTLSPATYANGNAVVFWGCSKPIYGHVLVNGLGSFNSLFGDGTITYIPLINFTGTERIKYWVRDRNGKIQSDQGSWITFNVVDTISNVAMTLQSDSTNTIMNNATSFNTLTNDIGVGLRLNSANVVNISTGNVVAVSNGLITFTPATNYTGLSTGFANVENSTNHIAFSTWSVTITAPNVANLVNAGSNTINTTVPVIPERKSLRLFRGKTYRYNLFRAIIPEAYDREGKALYISRGPNPGGSVTQFDTDSDGNMSFRVKDPINTTFLIEIINEYGRKNTLNLDVTWTDKGMFI